MNVITGYVMHQAERTIHSPRRLTVIVIALALIVASGLALLFEAAPSSTAVQYRTAQTIVPVPSALCPGETFSYHQAIRVDTTAMVTISRDWCNRGFTCDLGLHESWPNVLLTPLEFSGPVTRTVPASTLWKPGGLYEFRSGLRNGELSTQIVEFSIRDDCP